MGLVTAIFLLVEHRLADFIWETIPHRLADFSFYALLVCTMVGLATVMAAATSAMLRKPLATVLIMLLLMPAALIIPIIVGAFVGSAISLPNPIEKH